MFSVHFLLSFVFLSIVNASIRLKREFMYVNDMNATDASCFNDCNEKFRSDFEYSFNLTSRDFYDFPFHPLILEHSSYLLYCKLAEQKTRCFIDKCHDLSADSVFAPSNFICDFRRTLYVEARSCLAEAEPITFLKCDQQCHDKTMKNAKATTADVFKATELDSYETELDMLCAFQTCYLECTIPVISEVCTSQLANKAIDLLTSFVQWHANDIYEWHIVSDRLSSLPFSCAQLSDNKGEESIIQLIGRS